MPQTDAFSLIFDMASNLTGGLITDITSVIAGMLVLCFIMIGLDYLKTLLERFIDQMSFNRHSSMARNFLSKRDSYDKGTFEYDLMNRSYQKNLTKSLNSHNDRSFR